MFARIPSAMFLLVSGFCVSCDAEQRPHQGSVPVSFKVLAPQRLLDSVDTMNVYIAGASAEIACTESTGVISTDLTQPGRALLARKLDRNPGGAPCPSGGIFCSGEISLPKDASKTLVFQAIGLRNQKTVALGCTSLPVDSDPLYVHLTMHGYVEPGKCGNGVVETGEQCEGNGGPPTADDSVCDGSCHSKEILLSNDNADADSGVPITNAPPKSKQHVAISWAVGEPFHAVFQDLQSPSNYPDINYRQLGSDLRPLTTPSLLAGEIRLPQQCTDCTGFSERPSAQAAPAIARLSDGSLLVAYEDSRGSPANGNNISVTAISADGQSPKADELSVDTTEGVTKAVSPAVAGGPSGLGLVVWADGISGAIRCRIWSQTSGWTQPPIELSPSGGSNPKVAGWANEWRVVWQGPKTESDDILVTLVKPDGQIASPQAINQRVAGTQSKPDIAFLPAGEGIVVWQDRGSIMMQRFDSQGMLMDSDQSASVGGNGSAENPCVAGSSLINGFFAIGWQSSGQIQGRFVDPTAGFLFNPVDGQDVSFEVGRADGAAKGMRSFPRVAVGGNDQVVFAWQDESNDHYGLYARAFPLPTR